MLWVHTSFGSGSTLTWESELLSNFKTELETTAANLEIFDCIVDGVSGSEYLYFSWVASSNILL
jgi:hypothetical protein